MRTGKVIGSIIVVIACLFFTCDKNTSAMPASLCDIRNKSDKFAGRTVQATGWIYADLERFVLEDNGHCAVGLDYFEAAHKRLSVDPVTKQFDARLAAAKHDSFNTMDEVFVIVEGRFATESQWKDRGRPGTLLIERIVCSTDISRKASTQAEEESECRGQK